MDFGQVLVGTELKNMLTRYTEDSNISDLLIADWINSAIAEFPKEAFLALTEEYTEVIKGVENELPYNFLSLISVSLENEDENTYETYKKSSQVKITKTDKIIFPETQTSATMRITYYPIISAYDELTDVIPIRAQYRMPIRYFLLSEYYSREGEGSIEEHRLSQDYYSKFLKTLDEANQKTIERETTGSTSMTNVLPKRGATKRGNGSTSTFLTYDGNGDVEDA